MKKYIRFDKTRRIKSKFLITFLFSLNLELFKLILCNISYTLYLKIKYLLPDAM